MQSPSVLRTHATISFHLRALLIVAALAAASGSLHAQSGERWQLLDFGLESGFLHDYEWGTTGASLYFVDSLRGFYYPENEADPDSRAYYATTDGGRTWRVLPQPAPIPQTYLGGSFAYSSSGFVSNDGGATWQRLRPVNETGFTYLATSLVLADRAHMITLSQPHELDTASGELAAAGPGRLSFTTNGGTAWTTVDSMVVEHIAGTGEQKLELYDSTGFGDLPAPAEMIDTFAVRWWQLYGMPDTSTALVGTLAYGNVAGQFETHYYLGHLNLRTMRATWRKLPFIARGSGVTIRPPGIQFVTPMVAYALETTTTPTGQTVALWRSTNTGVSWIRTELPPWVDYSSLRFVNAEHGLTVNAVTNDGGLTWTDWAHPFEGGLFYASDSTHYFVANRFSLFASSSDAGRSWMRNASGAVPRSIAAYGGRVVVARNYQSVLFSSDRGATWADAGLTGGLPKDLTTIWAVAMPDSAVDNDRLIGVASRVTYDADTSVVIIETTDGGATWTIKQQVPGIKAPGGPVMIEFLTVEESTVHGYIATGRRLYASTDGGNTWSPRDSTVYFQALEMLTGENGVQANAAGIYTTTTSGATWAKTQSLTSARNRALGMQGLSETHVRALFPDRTQANLNWMLATSDNAGATWTTQDRTGAARPLDGFLHWRSQDSAWAAGRGATIQVTGDGGLSFEMQRDTSDAFRMLGGWVAAAPDERALYISGAGNAIAQWLVVAPPTSVRAEEVLASSLRILGNPVSGGRLIAEIVATRSGAMTVSIIDQLGRTLARREVLSGTGAQRLVLDVSDLVSGHYGLRLDRDGETMISPFVIVR